MAIQAPDRIGVVHIYKFFDDERNQIDNCCGTWLHCYRDGSTIVAAASQNGNAGL